MQANYVTSLGRSGLAVSRLGFGTAGIAGLYKSVREEDAAAAIQAAFEAGIRFFDTAPLYGGGLGEERLGISLRDRPRSSFVVSSKVGYVLQSPQASVPAAAHPATGLFPNSPMIPVANYSTVGVLRSLEESLERLNLERLDIVFVHDPVGAVGQVVRETLPALRKAREGGLISAIGVGYRDVSTLLTLIEQDDVDCLLVPGRYTLIDSSAGDELLPRCHELGVGVIAAGVYSGGLLASDRPSVAPIGHAVPEQGVIDRIEALHVLARRFEIPVASAAVQYPLTHAAISSVLVGARSADEVAASVRAMEHPIPAEFWAEVAHLTSGMRDRKLTP